MVRVTIAVDAQDQVVRTVDLRSRLVLFTHKVA